MGTGYMSTGVQCGRDTGVAGLVGARHAVRTRGSTEQHSRSTYSSSQNGLAGFLMFLGTPGPTLCLVLWCLVLFCWEKMLAVAADQAARMGSDKVLGTCAVRYCALPL